MWRQPWQASGPGQHRRRELSRRGGGEGRGGEGIPTLHKVHGTVYALPHATICPGSALAALPDLFYTCIHTKTRLSTGAL